MKIKFAHIADCHLGAWRNDKISQIGYQAFEIAIEKIIEEKVDFVVLSGDLYDISNPRVDVVDLATKLLKRLKDNEIPVYGILGSHDFSPSNKSMIRPLISAELFINVSNAKWSDDNKLQLMFTQDKKTGIKLAGLRARKRGLEKRDFRILDLKSLEREEGAKIFVFHSIIDELKPKNYDKMESVSKKFFPKNFNYYAGGHLHKTMPGKLRKALVRLNGKNNIIYPGCLSPVNFQELENIKFGGFCLVSGEILKETQETSWEVKFIPIKVLNTISMNIDCNNKTVKQINEDLRKKISKLNVLNKIVLLRIFGALASGKSFQINSNEIIEAIRKKGAYEVLINKNALTSKEYIVDSNVEIDDKVDSNIEIEDILIQDCSEQDQLEGLSVDDMKDRTRLLLEVLGKDRDPEVKVKDYKNKIEEEIIQLFNLKDNEGSL